MRALWGMQTYYKCQTSFRETTHTHTHNSASLHSTTSDWKSERQSTSPQKEILVWSGVIKQSIFLSLFIYLREREREPMCTTGEGAKREERERESQAGLALPAQSPM